MDSKKKLIEAYLKEPLKVGDRVVVRGLGRSDKTTWGSTTEVIKIDSEGIYIKEYGSSLSFIKHGDYKKETYKIGYNPFPEKCWNSQLKMINFGLDSILSVIGFDAHKLVFKEENYFEKPVKELNWNPFVLTEGNPIYYQRDFVWKKKDKQLLIESIYNGLDIGKIIVRKRSWDWVETNINKYPEVCFKDLVDGKQRLNAIIEFCQDKFKDLNGYYFSELSDYARNQFFGFSAVSYGELGESATDKDTLGVFLNINFTGVKMSQQHIDFVKSIKL